MLTGIFNSYPCESMAVCTTFQLLLKREEDFIVPFNNVHINELSITEINNVIDVSFYLLQLTLIVKIIHVKEC